MVYVAYFLSAAIVVFFSIKASDYIDLLDRNTKLSGAFLGGIMLSAVTSLPELFTSISATVLLDRPGLCMGNILGSDLFNVAALSAVILLWFKGFSKGRVSKSYRHVTILVLVIYGLKMCIRDRASAVYGRFLSAAHGHGAEMLRTLGKTEPGEADTDHGLRRFDLWRCRYRSSSAAGSGEIAGERSLLDGDLRGPACRSMRLVLLPQFRKNAGEGIRSGISGLGCVP